MAWLYVPGLEASNSPCICSSHMDTELFVLSNGRLTLRPLSWRGWKRRAYLSRLSGLTCEPSTASRGVASWISSLRATRASLSAAPDCVSESITRAISGLMSGGLLMRRARSGCGLKTYRATFGTDLLPSSVIFENEVSELRRDYSARQSAARRMFARESSSLGIDHVEERLWPTPLSPTGGRSVAPGTSPSCMTPEGKKVQIGLETAVRMLDESFWPTPRAVQRTPSPSTQRRNSPDLECAVNYWPSPTARDCRTQNSQAHLSRERWHHDQLPNAVAMIEEQAMWPTPLASDGKYRLQGDSQQSHSLPATVAKAHGEMWPTPTAHGNHNRKGVSAKSGDGLATSVIWATPVAADSKRTDGGRIMTLPAQVEIGRGRQAQTPPPMRGKPRARLNPDWVEQLMGWPTGQSDCTLSATEWCRWLQQWRSFLCGSDCTRDVEQGAFYGKAE